MPVLKNPKHERFAQGLAKGMTADAAYEAAGYRPSRKNASRLRTKEDIGARVTEIQARAADRLEITKADVMRMLLEDRQLARDLEQVGAAVRASELLGKERGMFVDRKDIRVTRVEDMDDDELAVLAVADQEATGRTRSH